MTDIQQPSLFDDSERHARLRMGRQWFGARNRRLRWIRLQQFWWYLLLRGWNNPFAGKWF